MAGKVEVNAELLRQASAKTLDVTDKVRDVFATLSAAADGLGQPWGGDNYGHKFANGEDNNGYTAARDNLKELTTDYTKQAEDQANAQNDSSKLHDNTDTNSANAFKK